MDYPDWTEPDDILLTEEDLQQIDDKGIGYLRELGFSDKEIARVDRTFLEWVIRLEPRPTSGTEDDQTSKPEKVDPIRSVIDLPHSLDPEEKKRIGYPLSTEDEEEILRRLLKRARVQTVVSVNSGETKNRIANIIADYTLPQGQLRSGCLHR